MPRPRWRDLLLLCAICLSLAGCATYGEGWGIRTWETEPADRVFGSPPHERIQVLAGNRAYRLEGARLEADSVIGFEERDDQWRRVALHRDRVARIEVKRLNVPLTVLWTGASTALWVLP